MSCRPHNKTKHFVTQVFHCSQENNTWFQVGSSVKGSFTGPIISLSDPRDVLAVSESGGIISHGSSNGSTTVCHLNQNGQDWSPSGSSLVGQNHADFLGWSIDLSGDGSRIAVGVPLHSHNTAVEATKQAGFAKCVSTTRQILSGGNLDKI